MNLSSIRIVLVNTSHPGNIGSAARAMKTMGFSELVLVSPEQYPSGKATAMASNADDILASAKIVGSLQEAIADCHLVFATSARDRTRPWPVVSPSQAVTKIKEELTSKVAVVFGRENSGLTNDELQLAQYHIQIPANEIYPVLNLAAAVQVICYEFRQGLLEVADEHVESEGEFPNNQELDSYYLHLERTLVAIGYIDEKNPMQTMTKLKSIFTRARLKRIEVNLLRGILSKVDKDERNK